MTHRIALAGVVAALSVASDLTRGHPVGEAMITTLVATELARRAGLQQGRQSEVYYATLLRFAGCAATSHEAAREFGGNDIVVRARGDLIDATRPSEAMRFLAGLGDGFDKLRVLARTPRVPSVVRELARADCEVGADLTRRIGLPTPVVDSVLCAFERYDGKGSPAGLAGDQVAEPARFAAVAFTAVMFDAVGGADLAIETIRRWRGRALDPAIADLFLAEAQDLLTLSDPDDTWAAVVRAEPSPERHLRDAAHLDEVLAGFGDAADLKSPCFQGHARAVAALMRASAGAVGVDPALAHRVGLVHDLGRVAIPTGIWEKPGPLRPHEWEQVRLHPYHSGRILAHAPEPAPLAMPASRHHERLDGSGYPAGVRAAELDTLARLLAVADAWQTLITVQPHRPAHSPVEAAKLVSGMSLDRDAIRAVLAAAHAPKPTLARLPVDLTERELDVLKLLATGLTKRQIAERLFISPSTVHTHTVHIYGKCEVSTRAGLAMFAMRHGLTDID